MFKRSFGAYPKEKEDAKDMPLVGSLSFKDFYAEKKDVEVAPIVCNNCGVVLMDRSIIKVVGGQGKYLCEFCGTENVVPKEIIDLLNQKLPEGQPKEEYGALDLCFILDAIRKDKGKGEEKKPYEGELLIAAIDISGSMAGGKIEAVRQALVQNLRDIKMNSPKTTFVLLTFESSLTLYLRPDSTLQIPDGDIMHSEELLNAQIEDFLKKGRTIAVGEIGDKWVDIVQRLTSMDMTALGPATVVCLALAKKLPAKEAKLVILTDGLANIGVGRIENQPQGKAKEFYSRLGKDFKARGAVVEVMGVRDESGGNNVALDVVGVMTEITGGEMVFIESSEIAKFMSGASRKRFVARNTIIRVYTPPEIEIDGITGTYIEGDIPRAPGKPISLGSLSDDREVYLKFKPKGNMKAKKVPIQIQMEYQNEENRKCVRVIKQEVSVADAATFRKQFDPTLVSNQVVQEANEDYQKNDVAGARQKVNAYMGTLKAQAAAPGAPPAPKMAEAMNLVQDEMTEWDASEKEMEEQKVVDKKSARASKGQALKRMSVDDRQERMKKRAK